MSSKALIVLLAGLLVIGAFSVFVVDERERAIKLQLGEIKRTDYEPGLHFKLPFVQNVLKFDDRVLNLDSEPELYLTIEKKNVKVDSFVKWRVADVERFDTATRGDLRVAANRLYTIVQKRLKDEFGKRTVNDVVSGERALIMDILTLSAEDLNAKGIRFSSDERSGTALPAKDQARLDLGIEIVDVRIKRIDLPEEVSVSVYQRMAAERKEVAKDFRSQGEKVARTIRAEAEREREVILAEADRDGQRIRGEGDGRAADIYAIAYSEDREFYNLYRSLNAYKNVFNDRGDILLIQPDSQFLRYFKDPSGVR